MGCRAGVRAPRWYRPAPSGLNGAAHRAGARRPAAAVDPGDLWRATGPAKAGSPQGCPGRAAAPSRPHEAAAGRPCTGVPGRRDTGTRQPPPDTSGHLFDYVNKQKNYKADRRSAAKLSLNQSRGAPDRSMTPIVLITRLAALAEAVAELRESQQHAAQAAAALAAAGQLHAAAHPAPPAQPRPAQRASTAAQLAGQSFPPPATHPATGQPGPAPGGPPPPRRLSPPRPRGPTR